MNKQPEALRLADLFEFESDQDSLYRKAAAEFRRLHAENQALNDALQYSMGCHREMSELAVRQRARLDELERLQPKREPLTDEKIEDIWRDNYYGYSHDKKMDEGGFFDAVRDVELAHGIK